MAETPPPIVGIPACIKLVESHRFHAVGHKYVAAVAHGARAQPLIFPALGDLYDVDLMLSRFDGLLMTGSTSNVEPHLYGGPASRAGTKHDPERDATTLPLIRAAIAAGVPLLAICRGHQELNVALGGTLHQNVQEVDGHRDHRAPEAEDDHDVMYGPAHEVRLTPGGLLSRLAGGAETLEVNSLHAQGIDRLADGLRVEATAPDGVIEAVVVADAPAFAVGIQWHPEYRFEDGAFARALFDAFGDACRERAGRRGSQARMDAVA